MGYSRRRFLSNSGAVISSVFLVNSEPSLGQSPGSGSSLPIPQEPEGESLDAVISEAYGELVLSPERRYWSWEIDGGSDEMIVEYEVKPKQGFDSPDVLVMTEGGFGEYETKVGGYPIADGPFFSDETHRLGPLGELTLPTHYHGENLQLENIQKWAQSQQVWSEESPMVEMHALECLTQSSTGTVQESHTVEPGDYYVVFDWTNDVLAEASADRMVVDVSVRAVNPDLEQVEDETPKQIEALYSEFPRDRSPLVDAGRNLASAICGGVPEEFHSDPAEEVRETIPATARVISATNAVFAIVEDQLGYDASFTYQLTNRTTTWTRWGLSVLPVVSSLSQLVEDACSVTEATPENVVDEVENMLMSLGILVADLLAAQFGVAGRAASFVTGMARKYLLGFVARTLGLKAYIVLLRELYTLTRSGITEALQAIKQMTREIADEYEFLGNEDVNRVDSLSEGDLESSTFDFGFLSLSPECHP
jgi:hypothetical protein